MKAIILAGVCAAVLIGAVTVAAIGQASPAAKPYRGVVTGTDVYVRAGAGLAEYACAKVSYPTRVTVVERQGKWLKILPIPGTFSVVAKQYVRLDATGKLGTVTEDNVWIRAGGALHSQDFYAIQRRARKGTQLDITGETGDFYRITPPSGAYFWISARYVTPVGARLVPRVPARSPEVTTKTAGRVADTRTTRSVVIKTLHSEAEIKTATAKFRAVDNLLKAEFRKPAKQRDFAPIIDKYEALRAFAGGYLHPYIDARVQYIRAAIQREEDVEAGSSLIRETRDRQKEYEQSRTEQVEPAPIAAKGRPEYAVQGVLSQSAVFVGNRAVPKRYDIRGRHTRRIIGYVQCTTGAVDLSQYAGKEVGVIGTKRFEGDVGLIVEAQEVTVLGEDSGLPLLPAPTVTGQRPRLAPAGISPAPVPAKVPKPQVDLVPRPLPIIKALPALKPAAKPAAKPVPKPRPSPIAEPPPKRKPSLRPRPRPVLPKFGPAPKVGGVSLIIPRARPTTTPAPKPATKPTTRPVVRPLVPRRTGFPMIESGGKGAESPINEKEYE